MNSYYDRLLITILALAILMAAILSQCSHALADDQFADPGNMISFGPDSWPQMLVEIEQCRIDKRIIVEQDERINIQEQIIAGKDELIRLIQEQKEIQRQTIGDLQGVIKTQKESYEQIIKDSKPSVIEQIFRTIGMMLVGIGIGVLL